MESIVLMVDSEIKALGETLVSEIADIKAKKGLAIYLSDASPALLSLAANYSKVGADIKKPDDIAYLVKCLALALLPAPAPVAAVVG